MNINIKLLERKLNNEWIAFVDQETLESVLKLREYFCPEVIKEVENVLSFSTTPEERKDLFYRDYIKAINELPSDMNSNSQKPTLTLI